MSRLVLLAGVLVLPACSVMVGNDDGPPRPRSSRAESTVATVLPEGEHVLPLCVWTSREEAGNVATSGGGRLVLRTGELTLATTKADATTGSVELDTLTAGASASLSRSCDGTRVVAESGAAPAVLSFAGRRLPPCVGEVVVTLGVSGPAGAEAVFRDFTLAGVCADPFTTPRSF